MLVLISNHLELKQCTKLNLLVIRYVNIEPFGIETSKFDMGHEHIMSLISNHLELKLSFLFAKERGADIRVNIEPFGIETYKLGNTVTCKGVNIEPFGIETRSRSVH